MIGSGAKACFHDVFFQFFGWNWFVVKLENLLSGVNETIGCVTYGHCNLSARPLMVEGGPVRDCDWPASRCLNCRVVVLCAEWSIICSSLHCTLLRREQAT